MNDDSVLLDSRALVPFSVAHRSVVSEYDYSSTDTRRPLRAPGCGFQRTSHSSASLPLCANPRMGIFHTNWGSAHSYLCAFWGRYIGTRFTAETANSSRLTHLGVAGAVLLVLPGAQGPGDPRSPPPPPAPRRLLLVLRPALILRPVTTNAVFKP